MKKKKDIYKTLPLSPKARKAFKELVRLVGGPIIDYKGLAKRMLIIEEVKDETKKIKGLPKFYDEE